MTPVIILAGGKSTRMGTDKLALRFEGETLLERAVRRFAARFDTVCVSKSNSTEPTKALALPDIHPGLGPISGLHAALCRYDSAFLVAADMPLADPDLAARIIAEGEGEAACAAVSNGRTEPLFAFYSRDILPQVERAIESGDFSLHRLLKRVATKYIELAPETLININRPEDYENLLGRS